MGKEFNEFYSSYEMDTDTLYQMIEVENFREMVCLMFWVAGERNQLNKVLNDISTNENPSEEGLEDKDE